MLRRIPIHPFAFAIFPILALLAYNISEVAPRVALRSLVISFSVAVIILCILALLSRNWQKAGLATSLLLVLFFSYGQVYEFLQAHPIFGVSLGRHRYLSVIFAILILAGLATIFFKLKDAFIFTQVFNIISILLLIYPLYRIVSYGYHTASDTQHLMDNPYILDTSALNKPKDLPDIYFIILDGYTRGDAFLNDLGFDNSAFTTELRSIGFYVADCSRSNYKITRPSLTTALNMNYLPALIDELNSQGLTNSEDVWMLLKQSKVRFLLKSMGYKTVAFDSGFEWSRITDADMYLKYTGVPYEMQTFQPFEAMLIRSSALLIWSDTFYRSLPAYTDTPFTTISFGLEDHINRELYILDQLPRIPFSPDPKFIFVHIMIPHPPFIFLPDGEIQTDTSYYRFTDTWATNDDTMKAGYLNEIQFLNNRIPEILQTIITKSAVPPIIILMGDHGPTFADRFLNLSAYYLPEAGKQALYPSITPVNSFRVIFDTVFGTNFGLLPDISYDQNVVVPEGNPECIQ
jgi:hypothetical protein